MRLRSSTPALTYGTAFWRASGLQRLLTFLSIGSRPTFLIWLSNKSKKERSLFFFLVIPSFNIVYFIFTFTNFLPSVFLIFFQSKFLFVLAVLLLVLTIFPFCVLQYFPYGSQPQREMSYPSTGASSWRSPHVQGL